jgi:type II secretory ATPase GspE/PulE/Tfp pilus assembly ATPase PilB-like protein
MQEVIKNVLNELPEEIKNKYKEPYETYHAKGCSVCNGRGVLGREAIFEAFRMTPELEDIINSGVTVQKITQEAKRQGMLTLRQDGVIKALEGIVSIEEVLRITDEE